MAIWFLLVLNIFSFFLPGSHCVTFTFTNNCTYTVWPGILTDTGTSPSPTGFEVAALASFSLDIPAPWSGRFWGRTRCATDQAGQFACGTGECGSGQIDCRGAAGTPPASLIEITLASNGGSDVYGISLVDGFNLPVSLTPQGGGSCVQTSCPANVNAWCPPELAVRRFGPDVIGCSSACIAFSRADEYCCTGSYGSPEKCPPNQYTLMFKYLCPQASTYAFDTSTFTCNLGVDYAVTFCPVDD